MAEGSSAHKQELLLMVVLRPKSRHVLHGVLYFLAAEGRWMQHGEFAPRASLVQLQMERECHVDCCRR